MMLYLKFCFDCEKQKIVFELITNRIAARIELLVIVRLYCESGNSIYLMRNKYLRVSTCLCRSACVENLEKALRDLDVCVSVWHATQTYFGLNKFGMCALVDSWFSVEQPCRARRASRHKHIQIVQQKESYKRSSSDGSCPRAVANEHVPLDQEVKQVVGRKFSFIERE
jgi:hypothetical protein